MEGERRVQIIVAVIAAFLLAFAYGVGYYVGKGAGIEEEKQICEVQKRQLIKTLSRITPVSRPEPVEEKVVENSQEENENLETNSSEQVQSENQQKEPRNATEIKAEISQEVATEKNVENNTESESSPVKFEEQKNKSVSQEILQKKEPQEKQAEVEEKKFYLQVGVFREKTNALKLAQELSRKGFPAKTIFEKKYTRVIVGYFDSARQARIVQKELRSAGFDSVIKWRKN